MAEAAEASMPTSSSSGPLMMPPPMPNMPDTAPTASEKNRKNRIDDGVHCKSDVSKTGHDPSTIDGWLSL
ncbi:hypothetical protein ON010_g17255 [Phytophthora cinnamomi]|nr:hypothetical protein ON010_g17255 [Phytophthora cinnamomi]